MARQLAEREGVAELLPGAAGRAVRSKASESYRRGRDEWINSLVRLESGAAVTEEEREQYTAAYFAQPGADKSQIKEARRMRAEKMISVLGSLLTEDPATLRARGWTERKARQTIKKLQKDLEGMGPRASAPAAPAAPTPAPVQPGRFFQTPKDARDYLMGIGQ